MIRLVGVRWTPRVNLLAVECTHCARRWEHPVSRSRVRCPRCGHATRVEGVRLQPLPRA